MTKTEDRLKPMPIPCDQCPFTWGPNAVRHLRPGRLREICEAEMFTCHKTTREHGDGSERECAGFMAYLWENDGPSNWHRILGRLGSITAEQIECNIESGRVILDFETLVEAHNTGRREKG